MNDTWDDMMWHRMGAHSLSHKENSCSSAELPGVGPLGAGLGWLFPGAKVPVAEVGLWRAMALLHPEGLRVGP